ncbi:helix-turn-helix transcriptional regulator [Actinocorallia longicatena]|uniref:HTH araC/xylS-type domain-containing protein n=1 Tax=Actinocorallia longicatena TaxID=111803 RepID=A0ABP6Q9V3_9ACTN
MGWEFEDRASEAPHIDRVWRCRTSGVAEMTSVATAHWTFVVWEEDGAVRATVQGPESRAARAPVPCDTEFLGVRFALGASLRTVPMHRLVDGHVPLGEVTRRSFLLAGHRRPLPGYDDAEDLVAALTADRVLIGDPVVGRTLAGRPAGLTPRSVRRHFLASTGLTPQAVGRIERARSAASLLQAGTPISEVVHALGYYDHPHLARSLRRFVGATASGLRPRAPGPMSFLYKPRARPAS